MGFEISPVLWEEKVTTVTIGRVGVQSVAVRLLVEPRARDNMLRLYSAYRVTGSFSGQNSEGSDLLLKAECPKKFATEKEAGNFLETCNASSFGVDNIVVKTGHTPHPPRLHHIDPAAGGPTASSASRWHRDDVSGKKLYEAGKITYNED